MWLACGDQCRQPMYPSYDKKNCMCRLLKCGGSDARGALTVVLWFPSKARKHFKNLSSYFYLSRSGNYKISTPHLAAGETAAKRNKVSFLERSQAKP